MIYICYLISFLSFVLLIYTIKETRKVLKLSTLLVIISLCSCTVSKESCWGNKKMNYHQGYSRKPFKV